ncbi:MAG: nucleotidyltransferase family protein, partial [Anaerolineae bacterium]|nr:nucleotidyltransferase family protein [Anaerolineae bacterium]
MDESPYLNLWWNGETNFPCDKLIAWAQAQRLLPLIGWRAEQRGWALPPQLQDAVRQARYRASARQLLATRQLHELAEIARLQRIPVVIVKGQVVAEVYPSATLRIY